MRSARSIFLYLLVVLCAHGQAEEKHWSLQAIKKPVPPACGEKVQSPIDDFIAAKLRAANLNLSPEADRRTLGRRLFYDVTGLPPTPEQLRSLLTDQSPDAYQKLVEQLLDSPQYGEKWARH